MPQVRTEHALGAACGRRPGSPRWRPRHPSGADRTDCVEPGGDVGRCSWRHVALTFLSLALSRPGLASTDPPLVDDLASVVQVTADAIGAAAPRAATDGRVVEASFGESGRNDGRTSARSESGDAALAATLTRMVITEASSRPDDDPAAITDHILGLLGPALGR